MQTLELFSGTKSFSNIMKAQGIYNLEWERARGNTAMARGVIPPQLFEEILNQMPK